MKSVPTNLSGVTRLHAPSFKDDRGMFRPIFAERLHVEAGYSHSWAEMNLSHTAQGCLRGLHFQDPHAQAKLITVVSGSIFDVVVDLRHDSQTFGKWEAFTLSADDPELPSQVYIPEGFAHGIATPSESAIIAYLVSRPWVPEAEQVLKWDDPDLQIPWPVSNPTLSSRDQAGISFAKLKASLLSKLQTR